MDDGASTSGPSAPEAPAPGAEEQLAGERELLRRYAHDRSPAVREELVDRFMPLARRLAARYAGGAEPFDDLVQVASMALVKAVDRFDPSRGTAFSTFAVPTILGELKRHFRDRGWSVHVPRDVQERILKIEKADAVEYGAAIAPALKQISERDRKVLHLRFVEDLTQSEIAERVGVSQMHVSRILRSTLDFLREQVNEGEEEESA
jgi:RNA polymerase sigma-B factor